MNIRGHIWGTWHSFVLEKERGDYKNRDKLFKSFIIEEPLFSDVGRDKVCIAGLRDWGFKIFPIWPFFFSQRNLCIPLGNCLSG